MARTVRGEILKADVELGRFVRVQVQESVKLGYPRHAAVTKSIPAEAVQADPTLTAVEQFFRGRNDIQRRIMMDRYMPCTEWERARRASMSPRRLRMEVDRLLTALSGYLEARI